MMNNTFLGFVGVIFPIILLALVIVGFVKRMKRLWVPCLISLVLFIAAFIFVTTISSDGGVQKTYEISTKK